jgi:riboflavin transporter FmnP
VRRLQSGSTPVWASRSRVVAGTAVFAATTIILNETIQIPAPYASFLTYEVWEIPIVVSFFIFGASAAVGVGLTNFLVLQLISPGILATGPLYNLAAILLMLFGIWTGWRITKKGRVHFTFAVATVAGVLVRVAGMNLLMAVLMPLPPPLGFAIPPSVLMGFLLLIMVFNGTVALYTIPVAYWLARTVMWRSGRSGQRAQPTLAEASRP